MARGGSGRAARVALWIAGVLAVCALTAVGLGLFLGLDAEELGDLAHRELLSPFYEAPPRKKRGAEPPRHPYVVPSPGLANCRLELGALGRNDVSFGSIEGRPGHFLALLGGKDRISVHLECPVHGKVEPAAHRSESTVWADRFTWDLRPTHQSTTFGLRWSHPSGSQDEITIHWEVR